MKKLLIIAVSLLVTSFAFTSCSKKDEVKNAVVNNFVKVTFIDSGTVSKWIEIKPFKTQPYISNGYAGSYCTSANRFSTFNYPDSFGNLELYQSKSLLPWKFYVVKNGVIIDSQIRENAGIYFYDAKNNDEFLIVAKD